MAQLFDRGAKTAPSHYPRVPFHAFRTFQLLSSLIVGGIMSYFIWHLTQDHWKTPWTFIWLMAASLASVAALTITIFVHCLTGLNPRLNIAINASLAVLWTISWSLLTWYMSGTLANMCDIEHWKEDVGIMICRIYKTLFTFTLVGLVSTLAALGLDIYVRRKQTSRGIYQLQDLDMKRRPEATRGPFTDDGQTYPVGSVPASRFNEALEEPRRFTGPYSERPHNLMQTGGYSNIEEIGAYDTGYRGAGVQKAFGQD